MYCFVSEGESLEIEHPESFNFKYILTEGVIKMNDEHNPFLRLTIYLTLAMTLFTIFYIVFDRIFSVIISSILNIKFRLKGAVFRLYNVLFIVISFILILLTILIMQSYQFKKNINLDTPEKRIYRLKYKWMIEEQIWLLATLIIEILGIYRLSQINDTKVDLENEINFQEKRKEIEKFEENMPTQASEGIFEN